MGARFCFRARRYEKVAPGIGRDEERGGNVFHAGTEVSAEISKAEKRKQMHRIQPAPQCGEGEWTWRPPRARVLTRREMRKDRIFKPYGTL